MAFESIGCNISVQFGGKNTDYLFLSFDLIRGAKMVGGVDAHLFAFCLLLIDERMPGSTTVACLPQFHFSN